MLVLVTAFACLVSLPVSADIMNRGGLNPDAEIKLSPLLSRCIAGCEHAGTANDCFDWCMQRASNDGAPEPQRQAMVKLCGRKVGPALADCLTANATKGAKGNHVREAELHGSAPADAAR